MAIDQGTVTVTVSKQRRTWRVNIETAINADPVVTGFRELVSKDANGNLTDEPNRNIPNPRVDFALSQVHAETVALDDGTVLTGAQMAEAISKWIDAKDQEQLTALAAMAAAEQLTALATVQPSNPE